MRCGRIQRDERVLVPQVWRAERPWSRMRGLLGRPPLQDRARQALWLTPCGSVHTVGMRYPLDIVFLDRDGRVLATHERLRPGRFRVCRGARHTVELAPGGLALLQPQPGEVWQWLMQ
ncbi:DUF192 domain-containing protein [Oleiagrimonas soli]|uniref:DUF192 domain-containing protein n=1 Tax=Oleiagrimonas soli TaxID=1543381 RepID=A0A099CY69_9GAMM|nr:DUF192 domain-containing protein [Oleiagrimonas soli]KGI78943.1 hypothetical protein LF63_0101675 [Oleiagrimonas soli]MBB6184552.1 hypothetical protein [Oleiagrimonas soli]